MTLSNHDIEHDIERFGNPFAEPTVSIVIATHNSRSQLFDCLDSLREQDCAGFEIILVDNGSADRNRLADYDVYYLALDENRGPSYARNLGVELAKGSIIAFLDDDAVADKSWLRMITKRLADSDVVAVRGRILPKHGHNVFNLVAFHYDLGSSVIPWYLDVEGNCAIRKSAFLRAGGFDNALFGEEGLDLSRRLDDERGGRIAYDPSILVYHNFADNLMNFVAKNYRHGHNEASQRRRDIELKSYQQQFHDDAGAVSATNNARLRTRARVARALARVSGDSGGSKKSVRLKAGTLVLYGLAWSSRRCGRLTTELSGHLRRRRTS